MQHVFWTLFDTGNAKPLSELTAAFFSHLIFQENGFFFKASIDIGAESGLADPA